MINNLVLIFRLMIPSYSPKLCLAWQRLAVPSHLTTHWQIRMRVGITRLMLKWKVFIIHNLLTQQGKTIRITYLQYFISWLWDDIFVQMKIRNIFFFMCQTQIFGALYNVCFNLYWNVVFFVCLFFAEGRKIMHVYPYKHHFSLFIIRIAEMFIS